MLGEALPPVAGASEDRGVSEEPAVLRVEGADEPCGRVAESAVRDERWCRRGPAGLADVHAATNAAAVRAAIAAARALRIREVMARPYGDQSKVRVTAFDHSA